MSGNIAISGVQTPGSNGSVPLRREVRDLQANFPDQWNLYLLGLQALKNVDKGDPQSYYQLAGIHGMPYVPWDGVDGISDFNYGGYCTHTSVIFLTWHRPYLALYEQALYAQIQQIADSFPDSVKSKYVTAAQSFRIPYWDWAVRVGSLSSAFPSPLSAAQVSVIGTDGNPTTIDNPLFDFTFPAESLSDGEIAGGWENSSTTLRWPDQSGNSQENSVASAVANVNNSNRSGAARILLSNQSFNSFSNDNWQQDGQPGNYSSMEGLHNGIHVDVGGNGGHMSALEVSAFDPVFWLHHTNVDRLWSIWQALNPNKSVQDGLNGTGNFTIEAGTTEGPDTPLKPFWDQDGTDFWTSSPSSKTPVYQTTTFGYAYPETQSWTFPNQQAYQQSVRQTVASLYGANSVTEFFANRASGVSPLRNLVQRKAVVQPVTQHTVASNLPQSAAPVAKAAAPIAQAAGAAVQKVMNPQAELNTTPQPPAVDDHPLVHSEEVLSKPIPKDFEHLTKDNKYTEWMANIRAVKHGLDQTFRVMVFIGDFNQDPQRWTFEHNLIGSMTALDRTPTTKCSKCQADRIRDLVITGQVSLTHALLQDIVEGKLASLQSSDVEPYLEKNLHWRVLKNDGTEEPREQVPGLKVSVCSTEVTIDEHGVPVFSPDYVLHESITDGRPAGHSPGDQV